MGPELLLQYMWEHRLWDERRCRTVADARPVSVIDPGRRNAGSGPDFFNAKINIGGRMWAGNVEIHTRASEWYRHGHDTDPAYDSVILHVVGESDCDIARTDGSVIPQIVMPYVPDFRERYRRMVESDTRPQCAAELTATPSIYVTEWIAALGMERLYSKVARVLTWHRQLDGDWPATAYVALARALGFGTNSEPFELLARLTPLRHLMKHSNDPELLAAALFGQAGFLESVAEDVTDPDELYYRETLRRHHAFMAAKYSWDSVVRPTWKLARMRPPNFPHRRIALLVALLTGGFDFGRAFPHIENLDSARKLFDVSLPAYWTDHYDFGRRTSALRRALSPDSVNTIIINALIPLMYAYSETFGNERASDRALDMLAALPPESNYIIRDFTAAGIPCPDSFTSQALIQLHNEYCRPHKCIYCRLGRRFLAAKSHP